MSVIYSEPGIYSWYPSSLCSRYYIWLCELGYPNVDVKEFEDGEWALIEYYNSPVVPSLTRWNYILHGMRNILITPAFITKYVHQLDLRRKEVWDIAEAKTEAMELEKDKLEEHAQDTASRATAAITANPGLVERIAKNGMHEIDLPNIRKNIPRQQLIGGV